MSDRDSVSGPTVKKLWRRLCEKGSASPEAGRLLRIGLDSYLDTFAGRYLGEDGTETFKLVLGDNGEGKSHLLYCVREEALRRGHLISLVEAKDAGAKASLLGFGKRILEKLESPASLGTDSDEDPILQVLRDALDKKREEVVGDKLDPDVILPEWADKMRAKNLQPRDLADGLSAGLSALLRDDLDAALAARDDIALRSLKVPASEAQATGAALLTSLGRLPRVLGFRPLVLLVDEAEVAVEQAGAKARQAFLTLLRFINDHLSAGTGDSGIVLLACTADFWPDEFRNYSALESRLRDPGFDRLDDRGGLSLQALANKNKLWVRETFRGSIADYESLGAAILDLGQRAQPGLKPKIQKQNVKALATIASSKALITHIKRPFVKALAQTIEDQVCDDAQKVLSDDEAAHLFDVARRAIEEIDASDDV